jgi:hypothetical protein
MIRSDTLPELRRLVEKLPALREFFGDVLQVVLVLDACCVQGELRWRVGARKNPAARTYLHETIVSGVVVAVAPIFLEAEIQKYIGTIAEEEGASAEQVREEWERFRVLIRFYDPSSKQAIDYVDPKDADYIHVLEQADGDFVYTSDPHFMEMGARVMPAGLDRVLRDYARSTTIILTVKLGSGFVLVVGGHMIYALASLVVDSLRKLPPFLKLLLAAAAITLLHADSRKRILGFTQKLLQNVRVGLSSALSSEAIRTLVDEATLAATSRKSIMDALPLKKGSPAIAFAFRVCERAEGPLSDSVIAERIKSAGYRTCSRTFVSYVRRILRRDSRFTLTPEGRWTLRNEFAPTR